MSLRHMTLRDFVIVRELELDLRPGFTVLTGETGDHRLPIERLRLPSTQG